MNVLIYNGSGTSSASLRGAFASLTKLLTPYYAVRYVDAKTLSTEPWAGSTALLVVPGGRDLPYCHDLNGECNKRIQDFIRRGGRYIGFCAGAYYATKTVEFELNTALAVYGSRELSLYPGIGRGCAFPGFVYDSESGARVVELKHKGGSFRCYWNGGGIFVDAETTHGVDVIARYTDPVQVDGGNAAVISIEYGKGHVILSAVHPEIGSSAMKREDQSETVKGNIEILKMFERKRIQFLKDILCKFGLRTIDEEESDKPPPLSILHLAGKSPCAFDALSSILRQTADSGGELKCENDSFKIVRNPNEAKMLKNLRDDDDDDNLDAQTKFISVSPDAPHTPLFSLSKYFAHLSSLESSSKYLISGKFGATLLYGETVTSTHSMIDRNFKLLRALPTGFVILASHQRSGRGRGGNSWISPPGVLSWSMVLRQPVHPPKQLIFVQYLISIAVVDAILKLRPTLEIRVKWPNDIYAALPTNHSYSSQTNTAFFEKDGKKYGKISGSLISTTYWDREYLMTIGVGLNVSNPHPTTSLLSLLSASPSEISAEPLSMEELLATIMVTFEEYYSVFCSDGFSPFEARYYRHWLHSEQSVIIEKDGAQGRIKGIDLQYGTLLVDEIGGRGKWALQADGNSFDMMRGLLKTKQ